MVSLVYSFSVEAISNFKPNLSHNFFDRYSPIPVAFALFLFEPVKPFSNTRDKSDAFIPQPLSSSRYPMQNRAVHSSEDWQKVDMPLSM